MPIFLTIGFPIHFANRARSTPHGIGHKMSTVLSREVIEPILETRKVGLQHMLKGKKSETLTLTPPPYRLNTTLRQKYAQKDERKKTPYSMNYHPNEEHLCRNKARQKKTVSGPRPHQFQLAHHKFFYFLVTKVFYLINYFFRTFKHYSVVWQY